MSEPELPFNFQHQMYAKILVALDQSPASQTVFESALTLAKLAGSQLMLLHALSIDAEDSPLSSAPVTMSYNPEKIEQYEQEWEKFVTQGLERLKSLERSASEQGVKAEFTQIQGDPGRVICQSAKNWEADLIVMGRRGHSQLKEIFLGSVSNYVLHRSHCSVHIVQS